MKANKLEKIDKIVNHAWFKIKKVGEEDQPFWLLHYRDDKIIRSIEMRPEEEITKEWKVIKFKFACPLVLMKGDRYDVVNFDEKYVRLPYKFQ